MSTSSHQPSVGRVSLPEQIRSPWWELGRRVLMALSILVGTVLLVYFDREGYRDGNDPKNEISLLDAFYYTTVTLSTTGYGDIAPADPQARLINALVITPARIAFLVLLIGTTLEVLASQGREMFRVARWRKKMDQHVVVVGYGTKGRSAIETLLNNGYVRDAIVVVDPSPVAVADGNRDQLVVIAGDATRRGVLRQAGAERATHVIIPTDRDGDWNFSPLAGSRRGMAEELHVGGKSDHVGRVESLVPTGLPTTRRRTT